LKNFSRYLIAVILPAPPLLFFSPPYLSLICLSSLLPPFYRLLFSEHAPSASFFFEALSLYSSLSASSPLSVHDILRVASVKYRLKLIVHHADIIVAHADPAVPVVHLASDSDGTSFDLYLNDDDDEHV